MLTAKQLQVIRLKPSVIKRLGSVDLNYSSSSTAPGRGRRRRRPAQTPSKLSPQNRHEFEIVRSETGEISFREKSEGPVPMPVRPPKPVPAFSDLASFFFDRVHLVKISNDKCPTVSSSRRISSNFLKPLFLKFLIVPETL